MSQDFITEQTARFSFAQVTPVGRSAIATLLVSGNPAVEVIEKYFHPLGGQPFSDYPICRIVFGKWMHADGTYEELVVARISESDIEINCHGGFAAIEAVTSTLLQSGGELLSWQELTCLQIGNELPYWKKVEQLLPRTVTSLATRLAMQHANGEVEEVIEKAIERQQQGEIEQAKEILEPYCHTSRFGQHLIEPWSVVIAGRPNAGKSSLSNQLVGYKRAIVNQQAGTTRDLLRAPAVIEGWPVEFIDTAGLREGDDAVEIAGMELARDQLATADLVLWVHDMTTPWDSDTQRALMDYPTLIVGNKSDLSESATTSSKWPHLKVSAATGDGVQRVLSSALETLLSGISQCPLKVLFCEEMDKRIQSIIAEMVLS